MVGGFAKVNQREVILRAVFVYSGTTPDNLLELGHAADLSLQHNQAAGLRIHPGRQQTGGGDDNRHIGFGVNEIAQLFFALCIITRDAHHVARMFFNQVSVFIDESLAHAGGVWGVYAKHNGFLKAVTTGFEVVAHPLGNARGAVVDDEVAVKVFLVVKPVFNFLPVLVYFTGRGAVAFNVHIQMHLDDFVRCQKAIAYALLEAVGKNGRAKVVAVGDVFGFFGRGCHANLCGGAEVRQDFAPGGIFSRAAAMAFVNHDEVKEAGGEFFEQLLPFFRASDGLVQAKVDLIGWVNAALFSGRGVGVVAQGERQVNAGAVCALDGLGVDTQLGHG